MRWIVSLFFICLISSCSLIQINTTGASLLTQEQLERFVPFPQRGDLKSFKQQQPLKIYVINSKQIQELINETEYVWIHKWRPFCSAEKCQLIAPFEKKAEQLNVTLSFITETTDMEEIDTVTKYANYSLPIYFGWPEEFGNKIGKARKRMQLELLKGQNAKVAKFADDYLYKNGKLIFQGDHLIDSLDTVLNKN